jgi:N-acetylglutamate synthase-like GNAT family acetyltransferase
MKKECTIHAVSIVNLADDIQYLEEASMHIWNEWHKEIGTSLEDIVYRSRHSICKDRVPQMYIAKYGDELAGVASIWNNDLMARQDLFPWLATVFVKKECRNKGIGTLLQEKCIQVVKELGYKNLYLVTDHEGYYERNGWNFLEMAPYGQGHCKRLYEYKII